MISYEKHWGVFYHCNRPDKKNIEVKVLVSQKFNLKIDLKVNLNFKPSDTDDNPKTTL